MAENTAIEWTDHTFNAWIGCTKVSPGCDHCYAERTARRFGTAWGAGADRRVMSDAYWREPLRWNARAAKAGKRERVFCSSMADVFDNEAPEGQRERLWSLIRATPHLIWLLLTKRIGNARAMLPNDWGPLGFDNVAIGATYVSQAEFDRDWPKHEAVPARWRFMSYEPALAALSVLGGLTEPTGQWRTHEGRRQMELRPKATLHWVIAGGESGPGARPMHPAWARGLRDECARLGIPFLFKQWGEWVTEDQSPEDIVLPGTSRSHWAERDDDGGWSRGDQTAVYKVGKKAAGRLLDGREHNDTPFARVA